jgi:imidazolonepropionase
LASALLIRGARQLLTLRGPAGPRRGSALQDLHLIPDGAVLIRDGIIEDVGPGRRVENLSAARGAEVIDATGRVVMPAFVDIETSLVHAHPSSDSLDRLLVSSEARDVLEDRAKALGGLSSSSLRRRSTRIMHRMARYGTGTVESRAGYALEESEILKVLRVQSEHRDAPVDLISTLLLKQTPGSDPLEWVRWVTEELLAKVRKRRLAAFIDLEYDQDAIPPPLLMRVFRAAAELGFGLKIHSEYLALTSAVPMAVRCGAVSVANFHRIRDDEIEMLGHSSTLAVFKPGYLLQTGIAHPAPFRRMIEAGVIPALGSSYHAELSSGYNMQLMLMLACRLYGMTPQEAIISATLNAAHALSVGASVGTIESGKQADLLILSISDYREVAYYSGVNMVERMVKRGEVLDTGDADLD